MHRHPSPTGIGLGLRWEFLEEVLDAPEPLPVAFFEVSPENYMRRGGYYPAALERLVERYGFVSHGLTLSLGAAEPAEPAYLAELARETRRLGSPWHSDHLCLGSVGARRFHDLVPLKQCRASVERAIARIGEARDALQLPLAIENISYYAHPGRRELGDAEFLVSVLEGADCGLLLDVNNVYVNAQNHGFDPFAYLAELPLDRVVQLHVAGHHRRADGLVIDNHGSPVIDPVYELLTWVVERTGPVPVLLERDHDVPPLAELLAEVRALDGVYQRAIAAHASARRVSSA